MVIGGGCGDGVRRGGVERGWSTLQVPSPTPIGPDSHGDLTFPPPSQPPTLLEF